MKIIFLFVCLLLSPLAFCQSPRKTVKSKSRYLVEQYEVSPVSDTVRTGNYRKYFRDGTILLEEGQYDNNQRTSVWIFYNGKGERELTYDYSSNKVLTVNRTTLDTTGIIQQEGTNVLVPLNPPPIYLASSYQVMSILTRESRLPIHLQRAGISQLSYQIIATVSPMGVHYRVIPSNNDKEFYQNAHQATSLAFKDVKWLPALHKGQEVTAIYTLPTVTLQGFSVVR